MNNIVNIAVSAIRTTISGPPRCRVAAVLMSPRAHRQLVAVDRTSEVAADMVMASTASASSRCGEQGRTTVRG